MQLVVFLIKQRKINLFLFTEKDILTFIESNKDHLGKELEDCKKGIGEYLKLISTKFGENQSYSSLFDEDISKEKPLLKVGTEYFCCNFIQLMYLLDYQLEQLIRKKGDQKIKNKYNKSKSAYAENLTYNNFKNLFGKQFVYKNLYYFNNKSKYETDILIHYDNTIIICEIKSNTFHKESLSKGESKLDQDLKKSCR